MTLDNVRRNPSMKAAEMRAAQMATPIIADPEHSARVIKLWNGPGPQPSLRVLWPELGAALDRMAQGTAQ